MAVVEKKLLVVGDEGCGKSRLLIRFCFDTFPYHPLPFKDYGKTIEVNGTQVKFDCWDSSSLDSYDRIRSMSYRGADIVLMCFSIDDPDSLENIEKKWHLEVCRFAPKSIKFLVGSKVDLRHNGEAKRKLAKINKMPVWRENGEAMADKIKADGYFECSAKERETVVTVFEEAAKAALGKHRQ